MSTIPTRIGGFVLATSAEQQITDDHEPIVDGFSASPPGTTISVIVNGATYSPTVQPDHSWSVQLPYLASGTYDVTIVDGSGSDPAGLQDGSGGTNQWTWLGSGGSSPEHAWYGSETIEGALVILSPAWGWHDGSGGTNTQAWHL